MAASMAAEAAEPSPVPALKRRKSLDGVELASTSPCPLAARPSLKAKRGAGRPTRARRFSAVTSAVWSEEGFLSKES